MPYSPPAAAATAAAVNVESAASVLVNATSVGDAGGRSDHFLGNALGARWTREDSVPGSALVGKSSFSFIPPNAANTSYSQPFTPTANFRIEARVSAIGANLGNAGNSLGLWVKDNTAGAGAETAVGIQMNATGFQFATRTAGVYNSGFNGALPSGPWWYAALVRDGANGWTGYYSLDRVTWTQAGFAGGFVIVAAKLKIDAFSNANTYFVDFVDVVS